jgi:4-coumarate--CoA ligase
MVGYLDEPDKTAECLDADGWLRTGDIAYADEDGYFFIVDRLKELIKVKGFQVAPAELEALVCSHPDIADCAVIPFPDERAGELPRAYVVKKGGVDVSEEDVQKFVEERAAPYKALKGGVIFVDAIPKTASGKILRRVVIEMDREGSK